MPSRQQLAVVLTLVVLSQFGVARGLAQESLADVIARCEQAVVRIEVEGNQGRSLGSGFLVDASGTLVTNTHVLAGALKAVAI
ncbi:MAG: hypothetical protein FJ276_01365, partial [Planctomycetes bacterium]|nr:hypothetical protein [Planctomycetota bacterium]